jgi:hypothetical protein
VPTVQGSMLVPALPAVCLSVSVCACLSLSLSLGVCARVCACRMWLFHSTPHPPSSAFSPVSITGSLIVALTLLELSSSFLCNEREREVCERKRVVWYCLPLLEATMGNGGLLNSCASVLHSCASVGCASVG